MAHTRSSNGMSHLGRTGKVPAVLELAALDDLGPKARSILMYGPLQLLAYPVMSQIMDRNEAIEQENIRRELAGLPLRHYLNPKDPALDALLAQALADENLTVMLKDREMDFALQGMKPLRRISREQRRHR